MRFSTFLIMTALLAVFCLPATGQATPKKRFDEETQTCRILDFYNSGWVSDGSRIFAESCKNCHSRDNDKGAKFLHSESKTMKGWNRVFYKKYPQCARDGYWAKLAPDDLLKLNDYLFRNAANTYDPVDAEDCG
jgi:hypothetical protein